MYLFFLFTALLFKDACVTLLTYVFRYSEHLLLIENCVGYQKMLALPNIKVKLTGPDIRHLQISWPGLRIATPRSGGDVYRRNCSKLGHLCNSLVSLWTLKQLSSSAIGSFVIQTIYLYIFGYFRYITLLIEISTKYDNQSVFFMVGMIFIW